MVPGRVPCPDENQLLAWCREGTDDGGVIAEHVDGCADCQLLVGVLQTAAPAPAEPGATPLPVVGTVLGHRYRVLQHVGSGAMGVVFRCFDGELEREVALKLVRGSDDATARRQGLDEARALARLNHPNVVVVHDAFAHGTWDAIAMEYVEGEDLRAWLRTPRRRAEVEAVLEQAAAGLEAAHRAGVIHRDFKPDNVMVGLDGRVRVSDFGLSRSSQHLTRTAPLLTSPAGTPAYMAPELLRGQPASMASDQFALCLTALEALTGRRQAASARRLMPWSRGLEVDPSRRWPSLTALRDELLARRRRRRVGAVALLVALAAALSTAFNLLRPPPLPAACETLAARLDAARAGVQQFSGALAAHLAAPERERAVALLRGHLDELAALRDVACRPTREPEQVALRDARLACLERTLTQISDEQVNALGGGGAGSQGTLAYQLLHLDPRQRCADDRRVRAQALTARPAEATPLTRDVDALEEAFDRRDMATVRRDLEPLLTRARGEGSGRAIATLLGFRAAVHFDDGAMDDARADLEDGIARAEADGLDLLSLTLSRERLAYARSVDDAQAWLELTRARSRRLGVEAVMEGDLLEATGLAMWGLGDLAAAARHLDDAAAVWRSQLTADDVMVAQVEQLEGRALVELGRFDEGAPLLQHAQQVMERTLGGDSLHLLDGLLALARLELLRERPAAARTALDRAAAVRSAHQAPADDAELVEQRWLASLTGTPPGELPSLEPDGELADDVRVIEGLEALAAGRIVTSTDALPEETPMAWLATALRARTAGRAAGAEVARRVLEAPEGRTGRLARAHALVVLGRDAEAEALVERRLLFPSRPAGGAGE